MARKTGHNERVADSHFDGPLKNRSCTDVICLLIFVIFVIVWIGIGVYAIVNGDPRNLLIPKDSQGRRCGQDSDVRDKPYLFFHDLLKCFGPSVPFLGCKTPQVCVAKCPTENYLKDPQIGTLDVNYCVDAVNVTCPTWYAKSESIQKRCIPIISALDQDFLSKAHIFVETLQEGIKNVKLLSAAEEVAENIVSDLIISWWKILIGLGLAFLTCLIYILMLRWIAAPMIWFSIIAVLAALGGGLYFTGMQFKKVSDQNQEYNQESLKTQKKLWMAGLIILSVTTFIILLMLLVLRKRISLAIALIKEGSKAVSSVTASLFFPIIPWILQVGVIVYAVAIGLFLASTGTPQYVVRNATTGCALENDVPCDPDNFKKMDCSDPICKFVSVKKMDYYPYLQGINIFAFFWLAFFVSALGEMVLAGVFAQWYWTWKKSKLPFFALTTSLCRTLRYHIGTLAFGSLLVAICRIIRLILEYIDRKLKQYDNEVTKAIMCCAKCIFWCLEKFIRFINRNAYIMCAIYGKNFCASAKDAFSLLLKNILRVWVLDKVTDFLFFISSALLTLGVGAVAYVLFATDLVSIIDNSSLHYGLVPVIVIMICTYLISLLFFSVYSMAVDTLFLCFLEDCEQNDGSAQKPYFMSRNLMKIFGKNNKIE